MPPDDPKYPGESLQDAKIRVRSEFEKAKRDLASTRARIEVLADLQASYASSEWFFDREKAQKLLEFLLS